MSEETNVQPERKTLKNVPPNLYDETHHRDSLLSFRNVSTISLEKEKLS
jgi:hypothetical protein